MCDEVLFNQIMNYELLNVQNISDPRLKFLLNACRTSEYLQSFAEMRDARYIYFVI